MNTGHTRQILVPMRREQFQQELLRYQEWFNDKRPQTTLGVRTSNAVCYRRLPNKQPHAHRTTKGLTVVQRVRTVGLVSGKRRDAFTLRVDLWKGHRHLPVVKRHRVRCQGRSSRITKLPKTDCRCLAPLPQCMGRGFASMLPVFGSASVHEPIHEPAPRALRNRRPSPDAEKVLSAN